MAQDTNKNTLKIFFIKLIAITFSIIVIINITYNLIFAEKLENIKIHESFESVSDTWKSILSQIPKHSIFQTIEWQKTWFSIFGENNILNILEISNNDEVIGIAPFLLSKDKNIG